MGRLWGASRPPELESLAGRRARISGTFRCPVLSGTGEGWTPVGLTLWNCWTLTGQTLSLALGSLGNEFCLYVPSPSTVTGLAEDTPTGRRPHTVRLPRRSQRGHWPDPLCPEAPVRARFPLSVEAGMLPSVLGP